MKNSIIEKLMKLAVTDPNTGCLLWKGSVTHNGYGRVYLNGKTQRSHRVMFTVHNGSIPKDMLVLHSCDTPSCINPSHLFLGTQHDNMIDMSKKGRSTTGVKSGTAKLTTEQVSAIRESVVKGVRKTILAEKYNVTRQTIFRITHGTSYR